MVVVSDTGGVQAGSSQECVGPAGASEGEEEEDPGTARSWVSVCVCVVCVCVCAGEGQWVSQDTTDARAQHGYTTNFCTKSTSN